MSSERKARKEELMESQVQREQAEARLEELLREGVESGPAEPFESGYFDRLRARINARKPRSLESKPLEGLDISKDFRSLTNFKRETPKFLDELKASGRALVLTVNGEAELAVMSAATFQRVLDALDLLDSLQCIREGLDQAKRGEGMPVDEFFATFRKRYALGRPDA